jgi:omega-6 fatty acid desaturase (delta-12 desaturase)
MDSALHDGSWKTIVARYSRSHSGRALWQLANSLIPLAALWCLMVWSLEISYWITLPLIIVSAGFMIRIFIILHDCGHGSFLASRRASDIIGFVTGVLTFTPYAYWTHTHAIHHATSGNLDRRGTGDIWTMTVREYREASRWGRIKFRVYRNPLVLFVLGPAYLFLLKHRFAARGAGRRWHLSVLWTNLAILALALTLISVMGLKAYLLLQIPLTVISSAFGVWLFYVQHQFEGVTWQRKENWNYVESALKGSSFYRLPRILQWFSGNIGFHHIHHLSPRIPNYFLDKCHRENALFQKVKALHLLDSLRCIRFRAWDEERGKLVGLGAFYL